MIKPKSQSQKQQKKNSSQRNKLKMTRTSKTFKFNAIRSRSKAFFALKNEQKQKLIDKKPQIQQHFNKNSSGQIYKNQQSFKQFGRLLNKFTQQHNKKQNYQDDFRKQVNQSFNHQKKNQQLQKLKREQSDYLNKDYHGYLSPSIGLQKDHFGIKKNFNKKIYSPNIIKKKNSSKIFWASKKKDKKIQPQKIKNIVEINKENQQIKNKVYQSNASLSQKIHDQIVQKYFGAKRKFQENQDTNKNNKINFKLEKISFEDIEQLKEEYQLLYNLNQFLQGKLSLDNQLEQLSNMNNSKEFTNNVINLFTKQKILYNNILIFFKVEIFFMITFSKRNFQEIISKRDFNKVLHNILDTFNILWNILKKIYQKSQYKKISNKILSIFKQYNISKDKNTVKNITNKFQVQIKQTLFLFYMYFDQLKKFQEFKKLDQNLFTKKSQTIESFQQKIELILLKGNKNLSELMCESTIKEQEDLEKQFKSNLLKEEPNFIFQPINQQKYLQEKRVQRKYTLVIDLDETLVHFEENNQGGRFLVRPFTHYFLQSLYQYFELVIFTAAMKDYADWIIDKIDKNDLISFRLYRQHTILEGGVYNKDLSKLGRCLMKTLIIDNNQSNFQRQPENGILIKNWYDDPNDIALKELSETLIQIVQNNPDDIREALKLHRLQLKN